MNDLLGKDGAIKILIKNTVEHMLEEERTAYLGYTKHSKSDNNNARNGSSKKHLRGDFGNIEIQVPRDRNGEFEPTVLKKHEKNIGVLDEKIINTKSAK